MAIYHLHAWSVRSDADLFSAPELVKMYLAGCRAEDNKNVHTSYIKKVDGRVITTSSGSTYILEDVSPEYLKWMHDNDEVYDPNNPIRTKKRA